MNETNDYGHEPEPWRRPAALAIATAVLIAAFYLLREHWGHLLGLWPYLLLLACPLMHMLHRHGGHGHGGHDTGSRADRTPSGGTSIPR